MRKLIEIIESTKDGFEPTKDELYYSFLVMVALYNIDHKLIMDFPEKVSDTLWVELQADEAFKRYKWALDQDPQAYLGWNNDPHNPDYQKERRMFSKIIDRFV